MKLDSEVFDFLKHQLLFESQLKYNHFFFHFHCWILSRQNYFFSSWCLILLELSFLVCCLSLLNYLDLIRNEKMKLDSEVSDCLKHQLLFQSQLKYNQFYLHCQCRQKYLFLSCCVILFVSFFLSCYLDFLSHLTDHLMIDFF